jgi:hypothetical protein
MRHPGRDQLNEQRMNKRAMNEIAKDILMAGFDTIQMGFEHQGSEAVGGVNFDAKALADLIRSSGSPDAEEAAQAVEDDMLLAREFGASLFLSYSPAIDIKLSVKAGKVDRQALQDRISDILSY